MKKINFISCCVVIAYVCLLYGFAPKPFVSKGSVKINLKHYIDNELLKLDTLKYKNTAGQVYAVTKFKYYIGNICLKNIDGKEFISKEYFLINEEEEDTKQLVLENIPAGNYVSMSFIIGVDSLHNCSGVQSGALDPVNGMFWAWNTGYIFLKLEGNSSYSKSPGGVFEFHIGGYKQPSNCIRKVELKFNSQVLNIAAKSSSVDIKVNAAEILKTPTSIDFSVLSSVTTPQYAPVIANNYADMFSVLLVRNEN